MPELPEVEIIVRKLTKFVISDRIKEVKVIDRKLKDKNLHSLVGKRFTGINRRGKYILFKLYPSKTLICHLGMTGKLFWERREKLADKHLRAFFTCEQGVLSFYDQRRFGSLFITENGKALDHLGIEPLSSKLNQEHLYAFTSQSRAQIKNFLMDQRKVAGLGNIYAQEILFTAGIHPQREARSLSAKEVGLIVKTTKSILKEAIRLGGSTIRDYESAKGEQGEFQKSLQVYGREGETCSRCGQPINRIKQAGRNTYFCPSCQC